MITVRSLSRRKVFKAFLKSILSRIHGFDSLAFVKYLLAACSADSHPAFVPQPNCTGLNLFPNVSNMRRLTALATMRRKVFPMVMGRTPLSGLRRAIRLAPKKIGQTWDGTTPLRITFTMVFMAWRRREPAAPVWRDISSFMCCGLSLSGTEAEPDLKARMVSSIVVVDTEIGSGELSGGGGICRSWGEGGCR